MDKRKHNGGNSTKSKKAFDRRKKLDLPSLDESFNEFTESINDQMRTYYSFLYSGFLNNTIKHGMHYVYFHYLNGQVVYIGKGKNERCFSNNRLIEMHSESLKNNDIVVKVVANNLEENIALLIERSLIKELNPIYNTSHNGQTSIKWQ